MSDYIVKTEQQILESMLDSLKAGLIDIGVTNPQVGKGSDYYIMYSAIAAEIGVVGSNISQASEQVMPDTATGTDLDRVLDMYGLTRREASIATGQITFSTTQTTLVATNAQLVSSYGNVYKVSVGGIYSNNQSIDLESVGTGEDINLDAGSVLTWTNPPAFASSTCVVSRAISGGKNKETDAEARTRLLNRLRNPPACGNSAHIIDICTKNDAVQNAFVYPVANGGSTVHIALTAAPTKTSKARSLTQAKTNELSYIVQAELPEYVDGYVTTVNGIDVDVAFKLNIPTKLSNKGFIDYSPFPQPSATYPRCYVLSMTSSTQFDIVAEEEPRPIAGSTHISWIDKTTFKVQNAVIVSATWTDASPPYYSVVIDSPFAGLAVNDYVFPSCVNGQSYVDAVYAHFATLGPGEKTSQNHTNREPKPSVSNPCAIDDFMLRALERSSSEIVSANYWYRTYESNPSVPSVIMTEPNIFIPRNIGFYYTEAI